MKTYILSNFLTEKVATGSSGVFAASYYVPQRRYKIKNKAKPQAQQKKLTLFGYATHRMFHHKGAAESTPMTICF